MKDLTRINVRVSGIRDLLFDRYPGYKDPQFPTPDKLYLDENQGLVIPALNLFSLLCATNSKSVRKYGGGSLAVCRARNVIADAIGAYVDIQPMTIPLLGAGDKQIMWGGEWNPPFSEYAAVGRLKGGVPHEQKRPRIQLPWALEFKFEYVTNDQCKIRDLENFLEIGGRIGLGSFRPFFGRYTVEKFEAD